MNDIQSYKIFKNKANSCFSTFMAEKKTPKKATKKETKKIPSKKTKSKTTKMVKTPKPKTKTTKSKSKKSKEEPISDMGIVIVDDHIEIDQEKVNEERRAYLEEARSQEAFD
jgi:outer membrane biosynthesis protein TonB